jgi:hypothetical protein
MFKNDDLYFKRFSHSQEVTSEIRSTKAVYYCH